MKKRILVSLIALAAAPAVAATAPAVAATPAEIAVDAATSAVAAAPDAADAYNALAFALARRARETADGAYYDRAADAVEKSLALAPENLGALKARAWLLLGKHDFAAARDLAEELRERAPDDAQVYGFLTDAYAELGDYSKAEEACDWMLKLRPGAVPGLTRAAFLREIYGDVEGALAAFSDALAATAPTQSEDRAWIVTHMALLHLQRGAVVEAEGAATGALSLFPDYHYGLAALAKVRAAQGRHGEAAALYRQRYAAAAHPENLFDVAEALSMAGETQAAAAAFRDFEKLALAESMNVDNANRELVAYYLERAGRPQEALRIATMTFERRQDAFTRATYAAALDANGRREEALAQVAAIEALGLKDPKILSQTAMIRAAK